VEEAVPAGKGRRVNLDYLSGDCLSASLGCPHAIQGVQDRAPGPRGATDRLQTAPDQIESLTSGGGWVGKDISCPGTRESYVGPPPRIIQIAAVLIFRWAAAAERSRSDCGCVDLQCRRILYQSWSHTPIRGRHLWSDRTGEYRREESKQGRADMSCLVDDGAPSVRL
jgi:hypothetical protein